MSINAVSTNDLRRVETKISDSDIEGFLRIYDYADIIKPPKVTLEKSQEVWDEIKEMVEEKNIKVTYGEKENC